MNLPLSRPTEHLGDLPPDRPIVVYCASGYRSAIAVSLLRRDGMPKVANLVGGLAGWNAAQLRTVAARSDPPTKLMVSWLA